MGIVTSVSGVVSLAAGAFIGGILSLAGAGLFLGASIPRVIEEKRILKANKEEAMTVLKKWLPDFPQKENTDSFDYSKHSLDIDKIATKENSKKASKKNLKNKGDNNNYGLIIDDKEIKGSTPKPRKSIKNKGSNNNFGIIIERKKTKGDNEPIIGCIERDK